MLAKDILAACFKGINVKSILRSITKISFSSIAALTLFGCVPTQQSEFSKAEDFVKPIDSGLYFLREMAGGLWGKEGSTSDRWNNRALELCPQGYKVLLINDDDLFSQGISVSAAGGFILALPDIHRHSVIDGVVLCNSSPLTETQARQVLIDKHYIFPEHTDQ